MIKRILQLILILGIIGIGKTWVKNHHEEKLAEIAHQVPAQKSDVATKTDTFTASVGFYSEPIRIISDDWDWDAFGNFNGNAEPKLSVLMNEHLSDQKVVEVGGGKKLPRFPGVQTVRFASLERGPVTGYVIQVAKSKGRR